MNTVKIRLWIAGLLLLVTACAARSQGPELSVQTTDRTVTLTGPRIEAVIEKRTGNLIALRQRGVDLLAHGGRGYFDANDAGGKMMALSPAEFVPTGGNEGVVDVGFRRRAACAVFECHYVLRQGEPGLYWYVVIEHEAGMPPLHLEQCRYALRVDPERFDRAFVADVREGPLPTPAAMKQADRVQDATYRLADGSVYTKYDWADFQRDHWGHGVTGGGVGLWMLSGSTDFLEGGPTKQELTVHATDTTPVLLSMLVGGHFLVREDAEAVTGAWRKIFGPICLYANAGGSPEDLRKDAKKVAERFEREWPVPWLMLPERLYPKRRGSVTGRLMTSSGKPAAGATVLLAEPGGGWQTRFTGFMPWSTSDAAGRFTIDKVPPGRYTLYGFGAGQLAELQQGGVSVEADGATKLGDVNWADVSGRTLWQVGEPDHSAAEFAGGDAPRRYGYWNDYPTRFPHDVDYTIGRSVPGRDWNCVQPAWWDAGVERWRWPVWRVRFDVQKEAATGEGATLWLAIAGADGSAGLRVELNGEPIGEVKLRPDSSVRRSANQAGEYRLRSLGFDAAKLRRGANTLSLALVGRSPSRPLPYPPAAVMYDCVRLTVGR